MNWYTTNWKKVLVLAGVIFLVIIVFYGIVLSFFQDNLTASALTIGNQLQQGAANSQQVAFKDIVTKHADHTIPALLMLLAALYIAMFATITILYYYIKNAWKLKTSWSWKQILFSSLKVSLVIFLGRLLLWIANLLLLGFIMRYPAVETLFSLVQQIVYAFALVMLGNEIAKLCGKTVRFWKYFLIITGVWLFLDFVLEQGLYLLPTLIQSFVAGVLVLVFLTAITCEMCCKNTHN